MSAESGERRRLLVIDADEVSRKSVSTYLEVRGFAVHQAADGREGLQRVWQLKPDVVLFDLNMPRMDGMAVLESIAGALKPMTVIVVTPADRLPDAVAALRLGAMDVVTKPIVDMAVLEHAVNRALVHIRLKEDNRSYQARLEDEIQARTGALRQTEALLTSNAELMREIDEREQTAAALEESQSRLSEIVSTLTEKNRRLKSSLRIAGRFGHIIGKSRPMQAIYENICKAAESDDHITIYGASGTGKALVAKMIHDLSDRGHRDFVRVDCAAIADHLVEGEFFGCRQGALACADGDASGYLDAADGGTLFLDRIGELNRSMQIGLLRVIASGGFTPIGASEIRQADIRILAAADRDLRSHLEKGRFHTDLYDLIHNLPIHIPPLKDRKEDIPLLVNHFVSDFHDGDKLPAVPQPMMAAMQAHDWPGNVRELQGAIKDYITLGKNEFADASPPAESSPMAIDIQAEFDESAPPSLSTFLKAHERRYLLHLLNQHRWHRSRVASILGIDRRTLFRKIKAHGLSSS